MKASTWNSYSVNSSKPVTFCAELEALVIIRIFGLSSEPFFLKNNLNPLIIPCLESFGGSCQNALMLVEVLGITVNPVGAFEGTSNNKET